MPFAIYETSIRVGDWVRLLPKCPRYAEFGEQRGLVREVILNGVGSWEITIEYLHTKVTVDGRHVKIALLD